LSVRTASSPLHISIREAFRKEEPKYAMNKQPLEVNADGKTEIELGGKEREDKY
jgi:hypothetical protein